MSNKVFTPENISKLKQNEVFVFGSNKAGNHVGGAARVAVEKFGAIMGHGEGLQGQSYAIPTLDEQMDKVSTEELTRSVRRFADYTRYNTDKVFYVTKIGCGIAGFSVEEIVEVFKSVSFGDNVVLPQEFGEEKHIDGFKGFDADMTCRGFKFEEGKTYEEDVEPKVYDKGFHFCESPFSVLNYRDLLDNECKFIPVHHVTALGRCHSDSDKTATTKIHIGAKLDFKGFIKAGIDFIYDKCIKEAPTANVNLGDSAKIGSSGNCAKIGSSGDYAQIGSSGYCAKIGSSGDSAKIGSSGDSAQIGSSGYCAQIGSSGDSAQIGSSGNYAKIGSSGDSAQIGSSGYCAQIGSSGDSAQIGSSGDLAKIESEGNNAVVAAIGIDSKIKAKKGSWITLAEYGEDLKPVCVRSAQIDGKSLKEDVFYQLKGGEFVEAAE